VASVYESLSYCESVSELACRWSLVRHHTITQSLSSRTATLYELPLAELDRAWPRLRRGL